MTKSLLDFKFFLSFQLLLSLSFCFLTAIVFAQKARNSFEVSAGIRYNDYANYEDRYGNRSYTTKLKLKGVSWGVNANCKIPLANSWQANIGIGYYKYSFNKISNYNPLFRTTGNGRTINIRDPIYISYGTYSYWYNTANLKVEIERVFCVQKKFEGNVGINAYNFITYSQRYKISNHATYKTHSLRYFAFASDFTAGINKRFGKYSFGPQLTLPLIDVWKQDKIFLEDQSKTRMKWLSGIGINIVAVRHF